VGTYGTCERCGRAIGLGRLRALPWTRVCLACARSPGTQPAPPAARGSIPAG
jgi:RNA polymerase-binding transcription factor DksA